ncbi:hypothetical protein Tco_1105299 [Tanacetum coccineum]
MRNSTCRCGGNPDKSSGNTSTKSRTTDISLNFGSSTLAFIKTLAGSPQRGDDAIKPAPIFAFFLSLYDPPDLLVSSTAFLLSLLLTRVSQSKRFVAPICYIPLDCVPDSGAPDVETSLASSLK